ncbi:TrbG/VirB9 family P-type conjugative transfer protein [Paraburkholderia sediminicola]|uniref:TrbG/VirB9 family P-type conjugative transfer protein n=1 Tax=Paraburkholderia sediminicola TaxID=458836 RepID=UPI0038BA3B04
MTRPHHRLTSLVGTIACVLTCLPTFAAKPGALPSAASQEIANLLSDPMSPVNPYNSGTDPLTMPGDARMAVFPYSRDQIFKVMTAPLKTTTIELAPGESLVADPALGDSIQWVVDTDGANHVFVKPTKPGLVNTMHLTTNQREYDMTLVSSPLGGLFYQTVRFRYPQSLMAKVRARQERDGGSGSLAGDDGAGRSTTDSGPIGVSPDKLNFDYTVTGSAPFKPETVFDDALAPEPHEPPTDGNAR